MLFIQIQDNPECKMVPLHNLKLSGNICAAKA